MSRWPEPRQKAPDHGIAGQPIPIFFSILLDILYIDNANATTTQPQPSCLITGFTSAG